MTAKRSGGRPPLAADQRRDRIVAFRVNEEELALVRDRSAAADCPVSEFVRSLALFARTPAPLVPRANLLVCGELGRIGNNVNQLTKLAHSGQLPGGALEPVLVDLRGLLASIHQSLTTPVFVEHAH